MGDGREHLVLLAAALAALFCLPLRKPPVADSLAISALATLWGLVCIFESFRAYRGALADAKVLLPLFSGLAVALGAPRSRSFVVVGYSVVFAVWLLLKVPYSWDSEYWQAQTDVTVVASLCLLPAPLVVPAISETVRLQMAIFYAAAAFWKINTAFLDPATSCASIYIAQLLDVLVPASVTIPPAARVAAVRAGPLVTIAGEMSIALLLLAPASSASARLRPLRKLGVGLALLLHLGIALTPPPNNIAEYGVMCALRLAWLLPHGVGAALADSPGWLALHVGNGALLVALLAARGPLFVGGGLDGWRAHLAAADGPLGTALGGLDLPAFVYGCVCSLLLRALALDAQAQPPTPPTPPKPQPPPGSQPSSPPKGARSKSPPRSPPKAPPPTSPPKSSQKKKTTTSAAAAAAAAPASGGGREAAVRGLLLGWAAWYSFGSVIAGTLDISSPNMFSNVRMQGGSNHLLLPTSLLQKWHRHAGAASAFSGGVVRVESTNSTLFLSLHPGEFTPVLRPAAIGYLVDAGHSGRQWNSAVGQVVGSFVMPPNPAAAEGGEFVRYTLPAFAIRDLVRRARAAGEAFALTYAQLDGAGGDEEWRRESRGRRVTLQEDGEGGRSCVVELPDGTDTGPATEPCAADELVLQGPPSAWDPLNWLGSGQSWNSYVVDAPRGGQLHCYGS